MKYLFALLVALILVAFAFPVMACQNCSPGGKTLSVYTLAGDTSLSVEEPTNDAASGLVVLVTPIVLDNFTYSPNMRGSFLDRPNGDGVLEELVSVISWDSARHQWIKA